MGNKIYKTTPYNSNVDLKKHRIGINSKYDNEMGLIERMVSYSKNGNLDDSMILSYYYISKIVLFWKVFKEYLYTDDIILNSPEFTEDNKKKFYYYNLDKFYSLYNIKNYYTEDLINKIPPELIDFISTEHKNENYHDVNGIVFASKLENTSLYEYLKRTLTKNEIFTIFMNLPKNYDEKQLIIDTTVNRKARVKHIKENINYYESIFYKKLDILNDNINKGLRFEHILYYDIFKYIASLNCLYLSYDDNYNSYAIDLNNAYILANGTGEFALNTWLYSFFEGVTLIGTSIKDTYADNRKFCAYNMLNHDEEHMIIIKNKQDIDNDYDDIPSFKKLYYTILNLENLETIQKELFIFLIFINIHEFFTNRKNIFTFNQDFNILFKKYINFFENEYFGAIFLHELQKFYYNMRKYYFNLEFLNNNYELIIDEYIKKNLIMI